MQKLDHSVGTAMQSILNDDKQGMGRLQRLQCLLLHMCHIEGFVLLVDHDRLFLAVYEHVKVVDSGIEPHLWTYRSRITLEHLALTLERKNFTKKHPILHEFLQQVCVCACVCA